MTDDLHATLAISGFQLLLIGVAGGMVDASAENLNAHLRAVASIILLGCAVVGMILLAIAHLWPVRQD